MPVVVGPLTPLSLDAASTVTRCASALTYVRRSRWMSLGGKFCSGRLKLWLITFPIVVDQVVLCLHAAAGSRRQWRCPVRWCPASPPARCSHPVPSRGPTSTSSVVSPALAPHDPVAGPYGGTFPAGWTMRNDGGAGSPNAPSNTPRSCRIVGDPNGSAITIVRPLPLNPSAYSGGRSYARCNCSGV